MAVILILLGELAYAGGQIEIEKHFPPASCHGGVSVGFSPAYARTILKAMYPWSGTSGPIPNSATKSPSELGALVADGG